MHAGSSYQILQTHDRPAAVVAGRRQFGAAVVVGSGIAGLTAARVLSERFEQVTVVDRDDAPDPARFRRGAPQTRHAHRLLPRGQQILEGLFPGLVEELLGQGAVAVAADREMIVDYDGGRRPGRARQGMASLSGSRPLLEATLHRRLAALPGVEFRYGLDVTGLLPDDGGRQVRGVEVQCRRCQEGREMLAAQVVVDASGRHSRAPQWLQGLGYCPPEEWTVDAFGGYATRIYERPATARRPWQILAVLPAPPHGTRGGLIVPLEKDRWHVTLVGLDGDYPPPDGEGFMEYARSLPVPDFYEAIRDSQPLTAPAGFRGTANRVRRYDRLPRYLEGLLVLGDAAYILNPVYAVGMTAAAIGSQALAQTLAQQPAEQVKGLSQAFQTELSRSLGRLWRTATAQDWQWPATTVNDNGESIYLN